MDYTNNRRVAAHRVPNLSRRAVDGWSLAGEWLGNVCNI
jgi:hypothetical protein